VSRKKEALVELVPLDELVHHPDNHRQGDVGALTESLREFGQTVPVPVQRSTNYILRGNHLVRAMRALGWTQAAVIWCDFDDRTARRYLVADNRLSDLATYNLLEHSQVLVEMRELGEEELAGTGYDSEDIDAILKSLEPPKPEDDPEGGPAAIVECPSCNHQFQASKHKI
jgi:ParB-like chromosome segregation protein Spo0J